ncbi:hypothetical protein, conserved [Eimeria necatrix]|uniref:Uncharacterized protein n=1 Tax=Eimeria necatrix TaxID=51315 RepID=U6MSP7_9EIME|nr:hypothetical protein, conserved [Eimeria necatrix]CDJ65504.1 hypothetical protein, conserved [Eimeria necatrix]
MHGGDDRDALLFGPVSSESPSTQHAMTPPLAPDARLFPDYPESLSFDEQCTGPAEVAEHGRTASQKCGLHQPTLRHRHISLFASIELARPHITLQTHAGSSAPSSSHAERLHAAADPPAVEPLPPYSRPAGGRLNVAPLCSSSLAAPAQSTVFKADPPKDTSQPLVVQQEDAAASPPQYYSACSPPLPSGKPGEIASSFKAVEGHLARSRMGDADAHRFVAQELQEINRMIQARAVRLKQQEEGISVAVAQASTALRQHAQQLLNQAAEKLERVATQQRRRAEVVAEEAAAILRRAMEARRSLRQEKSILEQSRRQYREQQQRKHLEAAQALNAERRRCVDLEAQLEALQQENRQLRAEVLAQQLRLRSASTNPQLGKAGTSTVRRTRQAAGCQRVPGCPAAHLHSTETATLTAVAVPATSADAAPRAGCRVCTRRSEKISNPKDSTTQPVGRQAMVDVQVRLPPAPPPTAPPCSCCSERHAHAAESTSHEGGSGQQQVQSAGRREPPEADSPAHGAAAAPSNPKHYQASFRTHTRKHRNDSAGSSSFRTDESTSSNGSMSSSRKRERRRSRRRRMRRESSRHCRSASRGSISTSTSSSSAAPQRIENHRQHHSSERASSARHQRITFTLPESKLQQHELLRTKEDSSSGCALPLRAQGGGQKPTLRGEVAERLQASLLRLQQRQALHDRIHNIAKQLLHPQRSPTTP